MHKDKDYIADIPNAERRHFTHKVELRAEGDDQFFEGYAAIFNSPTDLGWFTEEIKPGAFDDVLTNDVRALFNHDPDAVLGRTASGTMKLIVDKKGLKYSALYNPNDPDHVRVMEKVKRGDVSQSSFAFSIKDAQWSTRDGKDYREIIKVEALYDVAPVTYPAYQDTTVAQRSIGKYQEDYKKDIAEMDLSLMNLAR